MGGHRARFCAPGVDDVAEVGRQGAVVGRAGRLRVDIGFGEVVGGLAGPGEHLARLVRTVDHFHLRAGRQKERSIT